DWMWWGTPLLLNRSQGLLALAAGSGRVLLIDVATGSQVAALPRPGFDAARLELLAEPRDALSDDMREYHCSGVLEPTGAAPRRCNLTGRCRLRGWTAALRCGPPARKNPPTLCGSAPPTGTPPVTRVRSTAATAPANTRCG